MASYGEGIVVRANPFDGTLIVFQGDEVAALSGHRILDRDGTEMPQRALLQFLGSAVIDDLEEGRTLVIAPLAGHRVQDEAGMEFAERVRLQFVGDGVTVTDDPGDGRTVVTVADRTLLDELGDELPHQPNLQFTGGGVSVADDPAGERTVVTVPLSAHRILDEDGDEMEQQPKLQFTGDGVQVLNDSIGEITEVSIPDSLQRLTEGRGIEINWEDPAEVVISSTGHEIFDGDVPMPQRSKLVVEGDGAILTDGGDRDATVLTVPGQLHYGEVLGPNGTVLPQRSRLIFGGDGVQSVEDDAANDGTRVTVSGGGSGGDVLAYVSNCVLEFPQSALSFSGPTITIHLGVTVLVPDGRNVNGTWRTISSTTVAQNSASWQGGDASGIVFLDQWGGLTLSNAEDYVESAIEPENPENKIWYNWEMNITTRYDLSATPTQFYAVPVADFTADEGGNIGTLTPRGVLGLRNFVTFNYWEE
jgi:hypothetical protein